MGNIMSSRDCFFQALNKCLENSNVHKVEQLLIKHPDAKLCVDGEFCLRFACEMGITKMTKMLLNYEVISPDNKANYCIRLAALNGHYETVKLLLNTPKVQPNIFNPIYSTQYIQPNIFNNMALFNAIHFGKDKVVDILINNNTVNPTRNCDIPLQQAITANDCISIHYLVNRYSIKKVWMLFLLSFGDPDCNFKLFLQELNQIILTLMSTSSPFNICFSDAYVHEFILS